MSDPNLIDATGQNSVTDAPGNNVITADQTSGAPALTITASFGTDTIIGGGGDLIVDASANTLSVEIAPAMGGITSIVGGSGTLLVDPDGLGNEGFLTVQLGSGAATVNASSGGTNVTAGTGPLTIYTEDANLAISAPGGFPTLEWHPAYGEEIDITTDSGTGVTTVADVTTGITAALSASGIVVDASVGGTFGDFFGEQTINLGATAATVTASQGADTINAGTGDLTVDASGNSNSIVVNGGTGALTFSAGVGDATISGGSSTTIVTGGTGTIALAQHGYTVVNARDGAITVTSDGSTLSVTGEDGFSSTNWNVASGDTVTITTDLALHTTTLWDSVTGAQTVLAGGFATNYINGYIGDLPDHNVINLMGGPVTVVASQGTDTINGGPMPGDITVDATSNSNPVVVTAGMMGTLTFTGGDGPATVNGSYMGTTVTGGSGGIVLNQHGASTIHAHGGTITVNADGSPLTVIGADGTSNGSWNFASGDVVTISSIGAITTVTDPNGSLSYTLPDIVPPTLTMDAINSGATLNADQAAASFTISGNTDAEVGQTVTVKILDSSSLTVWTDTASVQLGGTWSVTVPGAYPIADGNYLVTADVADLAGNDAVEATQSLAVDETAPTITVNTIAGDNILNATEATGGLTIGGTTDAEDGQVVDVTFYTGAVQIGPTLQATVSGGGWSVTMPAGTQPPDGSYTVRADVSDSAGNAATPDSRSLTVDTTAPTVTINGVGGPTNQAVQLVGGMAEFGSTVTVWDGATSIGSATVDLSGHWSRRADGRDQSDRQRQRAQRQRGGEPDDRRHDHGRGGR